MGGRSPSPVFWLRHCVHGDDAYRWAVVITSRRRLRAVAGMTTTCCSNSSMPRTALMKSALSSTDRAPGDAPWRPGTTLYRARAPPAGWFYRSLLLGRLRRLHRGDFNQRNQSLVAREVFTTFAAAIHPTRPVQKTKHRWVSDVFGHHERLLAASNLIYSQTLRQFATAAAQCLLIAAPAICHWSVGRRRVFADCEYTTVRTSLQ